MSGSVYRLDHGGPFDPESVLGIFQDRLSGLEGFAEAVTNLEAVGHTCVGDSAAPLAHAVLVVVEDYERAQAAVMDWLRAKGWADADAAPELFRTTNSPSDGGEKFSPPSSVPVRFATDAEKVLLHVLAALDHEHRIESNDELYLWAGGVAHEIRQAMGWAGPADTESPYNAVLIPGLGEPEPAGG